MARTDADARREYDRDYQLRRYHERRAWALETLGGKCVVCGATSALEIDHIDPRDKTLEIAKLWGVSRARFEAEIAKCQLLCRPHHHAKSIIDRGQESAQHGTYYYYRHYRCRCPRCCAAEREARARW